MTLPKFHYHMLFLFYLWLFKHKTPLDEYGDFLFKSLLVFVIQSPSEETA